MKRVYFDRHDQSKNATLARVWSPDADNLALHALERRWLHNRSNTSCIPAGVYALVPWTSPNFGAVWAFVGGTVTPIKEDCPKDAGRWGNLVHAANYWRQLKGCAALGLNPGEKDGDLCVWNSKPALARFREVMGYEPLVAYVRWSV
jgi:hypothetical protein